MHACMPKCRPSYARDPLIGVDDIVIPRKKKCVAAENVFLRPDRRMACLSSLVSSSAARPNPLLNLLFSTYSSRRLLATKSEISHDRAGIGGWVYMYKFFFSSFMFSSRPHVKVFTSASAKVHPCSKASTDPHSNPANSSWYSSSLASHNVIHRHYTTSWLHPDLVSILVFPLDCSYGSGLGVRLSVKNQVSIVRGSMVCIEKDISDLPLDASCFPIHNPRGSSCHHTCHHHRSRLDLDHLAHACVDERYVGPARRS